jgi:hypothetical protein
MIGYSNEGAERDFKGRKLKEDGAMRGEGAYLKRWAEPPISCSCGTAVALQLLLDPIAVWEERIGSLALEMPDKVLLKRILPHQSILLKVPSHTEVALTEMWAKSSGRGKAESWALCSGFGLKLLSKSTSSLTYKALF